MEWIIAQALIQGTESSAGGWWGSCWYWDWGFWISVLIGIVGSVIMLFMKPAQ
jgi:hypothetical protein